MGREPPGPVLHRANKVADTGQIDVREKGKAITETRETSDIKCTFAVVTTSLQNVPSVLDSGSLMPSHGTLGK